MMGPEKMWWSGDGDRLRSTGSSSSVIASASRRAASSAPPGVGLGAGLARIAARSCASGSFMRRSRSGAVLQTSSEFAFAWLTSCSRPCRPTAAKTRRTPATAAPPISSRISTSRLWHSSETTRRHGRSCQTRRRGHVPSATATAAHAARVRRDDADTRRTPASMAEWLRARDTSVTMKLWRREVVNSASTAEWLRVWDTLAMMKLWRREVVSSIPDRGTIVGRVLSPTRQPVRFSHLNVPFFQNTESIWNIVPVGKQ